MTERKRARNKSGNFTMHDDGRCTVRLPPDEFGKRPRKTCDSYDEARAWFDEQMAARKKHLDTSKRPTVESWAEKWLESHVKRACKATTAEKYAYTLKRYVLPYLGALRLDQLRFDHVQEWANKLDDESYAPETVRGAHRRLVTMLDLAVRARRIEYNPARGITLAAAREGVGKVLSTAQIAAILEAAEGYENGLIYSLIIGLGLRRGEALGLRWADLNWAERTISVTQQISSLENKATVNTPKTMASRRTLPLNDAQIARLEAHKAEQAEIRRAAGREWVERGLIFCTTKGGPIHPSNLGRQFRRVKAAAGLEGKPPRRDAKGGPKISAIREGIRLHDLRHTFATMLGDLEVEERIIAALLGHGPKNITQHYAKTTITQMRAALERLALHVRRAA